MAVRSAARRAAAADARPPEPGGAPGAAHSPSHRLRCLVDAGADRRGDVPLYRDPRREDAAAPRSGGSVRRPRRVAAGLAVRRDARAGTRLLAHHSPQSSSGPRAARRPSAQRGDRDAWSHPDPQPACRPPASAPPARAASRGDGFHDPARRFQAAVAALLRRGGSAGGGADRGARPAGDRAADRLLCQHPGPALPARRRARLR